MASFEDYDEFGNYIGADLDSDDEDAMPQDAFAPQARATSAQPLEGFDQEPLAEVEEGALMQIDGASAMSRILQYSLGSIDPVILQNRCITLSYYTKTSSTILQQRTYTEQM